MIWRVEEFKEIAAEFYIGGRREEKIRNPNPERESRKLKSEPKRPGRNLSERDRELLERIKILPKGETIATHKDKRLLYQLLYRRDMEADYEIKRTSSTTSSIRRI